MKERDVVYLAGLVDGMASIEVALTRHDNYKTGFRFEPKVRIDFHKSDTAVLGLLDEYCDEGSVKYALEDREEANSKRFTVQSPKHITRFLDPLAPYIIRKHKEVDVMLNDILPAVDNGEHRTKQGLYNLINHVETLRSRTQRDSKYDREWFQTEWGDEIST